jgi:hypothetical protein
MIVDTCRTSIWHGEATAASRIVVFVYTRKNLMIGFTKSDQTPVFQTISACHKFICTYIRGGPQKLLVRPGTIDIFEKTNVTAGVVLVFDPFQPRNLGIAS